MTEDQTINYAGSPEDLAAKYQEYQLAGDRFIKRMAGRFVVSRPELGAVISIDAEYIPGLIKWLAMDPPEEPLKVGDLVTWGSGIISFSLMAICEEEAWIKCGLENSVKPLGTLRKL